MRLVALLSFLCSLLSTPAMASSPSSVVRDFFSALEQHDFARARGYTDGTAADAIDSILGFMEREATRKHAQVELEVRSLHLTERPPDSAGQIPILVEYDVAVFGKRWLFRQQVRRLSGTARFLLDPESPGSRRSPAHSFPSR